LPRHERPAHRLVLSPAGRCRPPGWIYRWRKELRAVALALPRRRSRLSLLKAVNRRESLWIFPHHRRTVGGYDNDSIRLTTSGPRGPNRSRIIVSSLPAIVRLSHRSAQRMMEEYEIAGLCRSHDPQCYARRALTPSAHSTKRMVPDRRVEHASEGLHQRAEDRRHNRGDCGPRRLMVGHRPLESARWAPSLEAAPHQLRHIESALIGSSKVKDRSTTIRHKFDFVPLDGKTKWKSSIRRYGNSIGLRSAASGTLCLRSTRPGASLSLNLSGSASEAAARKCAKPSLDLPQFGHIISLSA
jgi:hypothetical protein